MAIMNKQDLLDRLTAAVGEDKNDEVIALVEDLSDTIDDYESKVKDQTDWKSKYEANDKAWRDKYITRFKAGVIEEEDTPDEEERPRPKTFEELFTVKEK